jgi:signal transduction histidine kinase
MTGYQALVRVVSELSLSRDMAGIQAIVRRATRELTGADGATFVLREGDLCHYADEDAIRPLWKGQRFPMDDCISGWAMKNGQAAVIADVFDDPRIPVSAYEPTFVRSLAMVPIRTADPIGAIGAYWAARHVATTAEVELLQALADSTAVALENVATFREATRWRALLEAASDFIWTLDPVARVGGIDGVLHWWSRLTGRPESDYRDAQAWLDDLHPDDRERVAALLAASQVAPVPYKAEYRMLSQDGAVHHLVARAVPLMRPDGSHELVGMISDVTREREAELALARAHEDRERLHRAVAAEKRLLERLADCVPAAIVMVAAPSGRLMFSNPRASAVLGESLRQLEADLRERSDRPDPDAGRSAADIVAAALRTGQAVLDREVDCPSGSERGTTLLASAVPVVDQAGAIEAVVASFHDVTESKDARETLQRFSRRLLAAQDEERRRIARDLHDDLAQVLTAVKMSLAALANDATPAQAGRVEAALASVDRSIKQTRDLSLQLHPPMLDILGLGPTLPWYLKGRLDGTRLESEVSIELGEARFPPAVETACFRVVQEGVTNVLRHARAGKVWVELCQAKGALVIEVRDDGSGFDRAETRARAAQGHSAGLTGAQERVALAGGSFEIHSQPGAGTRLLARFPLEEAR